MRIRMKAMYYALTLIAGLFVCGASNTWAVTITDWNMDNVDKAVAPFNKGSSYSNIIFWDSTKTEARGDITWVEGEFKTPGIKIINGGGANASCVMAEGVNPIDNSPKDCNDPAGLNKYYEIRSSVIDDREIDIVFNVTGLASQTTYKFYQIFTNNSSVRLGRVRLRLGFGVGGGFSHSNSQIDDLEFSDANGSKFSNTYVTAGPTTANDFWGNIPTNLYGVGTGFFDNQAEANPVQMRINNGNLEFYDLPLNYTSRFGAWLPLEQVPWGYFFDDDNLDYTPPLLTGYWDGSQWLDDNDVKIPDTTIYLWEEDPRYHIAKIEDLARLQSHFHVTVGGSIGISDWPTYNQFTGNASFTIRARVHDDLAGPTPWLNANPPVSIPPPVANGDSYSIFNSTIPFEVNNIKEGVLNNDTAASGAKLTAQLVDNGTEGSVTLHPDGTFVYTADLLLYNGTDTFTYTTYDGMKTSEVATVTVSGGLPPTATNDSYKMSDQTLPYEVTDPQKGVLNNDNAPSGRQMTAAVKDAPSVGTLTTFNEDGTFTYVAGANYKGQDTFTYIANDGVMDSNVAIVLISAGLAPPIAVVDNYNLPSKNSPLVISDPNIGLLGNDTTYTGQIRARLKDDGKFGTAEVSEDGAFVYTANPSLYVNADTFTYIANDGFRDSAITSVNISGGGTPPPPPEGGGCTSAQTASVHNVIDPTLPLFAIGSIGLLVGRRKSHRSDQQSGRQQGN